MAKVLVTGAGGLIGTEACEQFVFDGWDVIGVDNDMRAYFFGPEASTAHSVDRLVDGLGDSFQPVKMDIRERHGIESLFHDERPDLIVHTAAQPSHDWAAKEPYTDFSVNALGTLNLLQATRLYCPDSTFIHCSTSKVYGDTPNRLYFETVGKRLDLHRHHRYYHGIDTSMSVDQSTHSLFGVSKLAGDLLVQEYGRYFGIPTVCFRPGCLTGGYHAGTEMHGFLSYLMRCGITKRPYTIFGYAGLQVRCNIHSRDLVEAFLVFANDPDIAAVYNIGGGRANSVSMLEAIDMVTEITGNELIPRYDPAPRIGDHRWWISDNESFSRRYPEWSQSYTVKGMLQEIWDTNVERWS